MNAPWTRKQQSAHTFGRSRSRGSINHPSCGLGDTERKRNPNRAASLPSVCLSIYSKVGEEGRCVRGARHGRRPHQDKPNVQLRYHQRLNWFSSHLTPLVNLFRFRSSPHTPRTPHLINRGSLARLYCDLVSPVVISPSEEKCFGWHFTLTPFGTSKNNS
jgi:hypothetical protein